TTAALLTYQASRYFATGDVPSRLGNRHASIAPYDTFDAEDGTFVLSVGNDEQWQRFCAAADLPALATEERFATNASRVRHCDTLRGIIAERLASAPIAHWIDRLTAAGVPAGAVRSIDEVLADPQLAS